MANRSLLGRRPHGSWSGVSRNASPAQDGAEWPMLRQSLASTGLQLDFGSNPPTHTLTNAGYDLTNYGSPPNTVSPRNLQQPYGIDDYNEAGFRGSADPSSYPASDQASYEGSTGVPTQGPFTSETMMPLNTERMWAGVTSNNGESCHLALSSEGQPRTEPVPMSNSQTASWPYSHETSDAHVKIEDESQENSFGDFADASNSPDDMDDQEWPEVIVKRESPRDEERRRSGRGFETKFICPICSREFPRKFNCTTHMETHNPNRPRPHVCPIQGCHKGFFRSSELKRHDECVSKLSQPGLTQTMND
ncbi:MAG: hypothetical protein M1831_003557 [Alyxoria varia]|nr:MAG: hypothetical protein M1831_003557 [Alyxoria varia]